MAIQKTNLKFVRVQHWDKEDEQVNVYVDNLYEVVHTESVPINVAGKFDQDHARHVYSWQGQYFYNIDKLVEAMNKRKRKS